MVVLVTCKNKDDPLKLKALELSQHFSHCKSMEIFSDTQGQLTPQSGIGSGGNSNSFKLLYSLPERMSKIQLNEGAKVATRLYVDFSDIKGR